MPEVLDVPMTKLVADHIEDIGDDIIMSEIEDIKEDYLDSEWVQSFDDVASAYSELGDGEAERQVLSEHATDILGSSAAPDLVSQFIDEMAHQLGLYIG